MHTLSLLGCGWLGMPLGKFYLKKGYTVKGSTTRKENLENIKQKGIAPYHIIFNPAINEDYDPHFFNTDILLVDFPPSRKVDNIQNYMDQQMNTLIEKILENNIQKVIFISSTSVYPNVNREVFENEQPEPERDAGKALKNAEDKLFRNDHFDTTVIRFSGLMGYDRKPGRFLANKKEVSNGDAPVNLIHQDDCIGIIDKVIEKNAWNEIFNGCADFHPVRKEFYTLAAQKEGYDPPRFIKDESPQYKIVSNQKVKNKLNYQFVYPNPLDIL